ncbi:MAG: type IV pilus secretin PilQ [Thermodesulfobacteriota bacterium]
MRKLLKYNPAALWTIPIMLSLALLFGCAHDQEQKDPFVEQWKMTAEKSRGYSPKAKQRTVIPPPPKVTEIEPLDKEDQEPEKALPAKKITMRMHETDVTVLLRALTRAVGINLIINDSVKGTVNIDVKEASWDQVFTGILRAQGLFYEWEGDILRIITLQDRNKSLEQMATEQKIREQENNMEKSEPLVTQVVQVEFSEAKKLQASLQTYLSQNTEGGQMGSVMVDEHTNSLIIQAMYSDLKRMIPLIMELDRPTPQILIEAHIVEATEATARDLGVQWGGISHSGDLWVTPGINSQGVVSNTLSSGGIDPTSGWAVNFPTGTAGTGVPQNDFGFTALALGFALEDVGSSILTAQLTALQQDGKVNILSSPSITTIDNQKAIIESGDEVPYQTVENGEVKIEYKKAVLSLEVIPHVIGNNALKLEIITKKDQLDFTNSVGGQPIIKTKMAETKVIVFNGQTTVIGGLSKEQTEAADSGVPWLKDIPVVGYLFKGESTKRGMEELLIFITPHILGTRQDAELDDAALEEPASESINN